MSFSAHAEGPRPCNHVFVFTISQKRSSDHSVIRDNAVKPLDSIICTLSLSQKRSKQKRGPQEIIEVIHNSRLRCTTQINKNVLIWSSNEAKFALYWVSRALWSFSSAIAWNYMVWLWYLVGPGWYYKVLTLALCF